MKKGILLLGKVGVGKTYKFKEDYRKDESKTKYWIDGIDLAEMGCQKDGIEKLKQISSWNNLYLDDIGRERDSNNFGYVFSSFESIIHKRYKLWCDNPEKYLLYIATNLNIKDLTTKYGEHIVSRIIEMCDIEIMDGEDRRLK